MKAVSLNDIRKEIGQTEPFKVKFKSFTDGVFTYEGRDGEHKHEFSFLCQDTLLSTMYAAELMDLKALHYLGHRVFVKNGDDWQSVGGGEYMTSKYS